MTKRSHYYMNRYKININNLTLLIQPYGLTTLSSVLLLSKLIILF